MFLPDDAHPGVPAAAADPLAAARLARLRHVSDDMPGIRRIQGRKGFIYRRADGSLVKDAETLERIRKLAIPPAYTDVWICPLANGHLQAVGRDARGRKQYRYHPRWREVRDEAKYDKMMLFGEALPKLRERVDADLRHPGLSRARVLAAVVRLLETTFARVGNSEYARENGSFGLTTLRNRHVRAKGSRITFDFRGKHGIQHTIELQDRRLANIIRRCRDLPGQHLFCYLDEDGETRVITSDDVNEYLREISGHDITAKDFRTWAATKLAMVALGVLGAGVNETQRKKNVVATVKQVAQMLGNTPAICRKCYVHPRLIETYMSGAALAVANATSDNEATSTWLTPDEAVLLAFLRERGPAGDGETDAAARRIVTTATAVALAASA